MRHRDRGFMIVTVRPDSYRTARGLGHAELCGRGGSCDNIETDDPIRFYTTLEAAESDARSLTIIHGPEREYVVLETVSHFRKVPVDPIVRTDLLSDD